MFSESGPRQMKRKPRSRWSRRKRRLVERDRGHGVRARRTCSGLHEVLDEPVGDRVRQVGEHERHEPVDRLHPRAPLVRAREVDEQAEAIVPAALQERLRDAIGRLGRPSAPSPLARRAAPAGPARAGPGRRPRSRARPPRGAGSGGRSPPCRSSPACSGAAGAACGRSSAAGVTRRSPIDSS